jgi:DNA-binding CsgD family transcriptional regulator
MYALYHAERSSRRPRRTPPPIAAPRPRLGIPLAWADFDRGGAVVDQGIAFLPGSTEAAEVRRPDGALLRLGREGLAVAGRIVPIGGDQMIWIAPHPCGGQAAVRGLLIDAQVFRVLIDRFLPDHQITAAEKRALFQLVAGAGPREAAEADGLSVETKRAQIKSLCAKLGCSGQTDLVRRSIGLLVHLLLLTEHGATG